MAWNEPGKRDPWRGNQKGPDLDETLRRLKERFGGLFGGGGGSDGGGSGS
ncbi:MAG TPA: protease modulator HflK N-terminal domain-containing protein, partial [Tahibacter sp.]|nr:protease modulator HflK N-terminal domain-containing protein [Tahibacter sp.]